MNFLRPSAFALAAVLAVPSCAGSGGAPPERSVGPARCHEAGGLPDPACTPGAANPAVTPATLAATVCRAGWTATVRPAASYTARLKKVQLVAYRLAGPASAYEEDHRVPLEVGGAPADPRNLWPEPWDGPLGAHAKDRIEDAVHAALCAGRMSLAAARAVFLSDWWPSAAATRVYILAADPAPAVQHPARRVDLADDDVIVRRGYGVHHAGLSVRLAGLAWFITRSRCPQGSG